MKKISTITLFRISFGCAIFFVISLFFLCFTALHMSSDVEVVSQFFTTMGKAASLNKSKQLNTLSTIVKLNRTQDLPKEQKILNETLVRYYLDMRYGEIPDRARMTYRWGIGGPVYYMTSLKEYQIFSQKLEARMEKIRTVKTVENVKIIEQSHNKFTIDFDIYENTQEGLKFHKKRVVLEFRYRSARRKFSARFTNPYGLTFVRVEETERK